LSFYLCESSSFGLLLYSESLGILSCNSLFFLNAEAGLFGFSRELSFVG